MNLRQLLEIFDEDIIDEGFTDDSLQGILDKHESAYMRYRNEGTFDSTPEMEAFFTDLYEYFLNSGDMPYGVAKARDGDPYEWIGDQLDRLESDNTMEATPAVIGKEIDPEDPDERFAGRLERAIGKKLNVASPGEIKVAKQKVDAMKENTRTRRMVKEDVSINTLDVNMGVTANSPQDTIELLRKLSGLPVQAAPMGDPGMTGMAPMGDPTGMLDPMGGAPAIDSPLGAPIGNEPMGDPGMDADPMGDPGMDVDPMGGDHMPDDSDMDNDFDVEPVDDMDMAPESFMNFGEDDEAREGAFSNSPAEKTFGTDASLNLGTDLNRKKNQYAKEYPGDNRMAVEVKETKLLSEELYKKYVKSILESLVETEVRDEEDRKFRCQQVGRLKQDQKAMMDPATRAHVLQKWNELRCGE